MQEFNRPGLCSLMISSDREVSSRLLEDRRVPLISFTGSTEIGRQVSERVSRRLGRCLLELGGNNALIVDASADLSLAVPAILFGAIGTSGQRCTTTRRILVHESVQAALVDKLVKAYQQVRVGDPLNPEHHMGPLVDAAAVEAYRQLIQELKAQGADILYGGQVLPQAGYYVAPTLVRAAHDWPMVQRETFVPVTYLITYRNWEDAIAWNNEVSQGLSSALFTQDFKKAEQFLSVSGSDCGIANINLGTSGAEIGGAFGGEKDTGGGREAGSDSWKAYMRRQTNTLNWGNSLPLAQGIVFDI